MAKKSCDTDTNGTLHVSVRDEHGQQVPIHDAAVEVYQTGQTKNQREIVGTGLTNNNGEMTFELPPGSYAVCVKAWGETYDYGKPVAIEVNHKASICFPIPLDLQIKAHRIENCKPIPCDIFKAGDIVEFSASYDCNIQIKNVYGRYREGISFLGKGRQR